MLRSRSSPPLFASDPSKLFSSTTDDVSELLCNAPPRLNPTATWFSWYAAAAIPGCCTSELNRNTGCPLGRTAIAGCPRKNWYAFMGFNPPPPACATVTPASGMAPRRRVRSSSMGARVLLSALDDSTVLLWLGLRTAAAAAAEGRLKLVLAFGPRNSRAAAS
ncbi:hypothetical protein MIMGU_mgv1a015276mg [Erythranthe guttata]|uniref:Uncharacterized protein n=1 Tax=Erythranthe guttata TaxID=4155 RepID=A0A022RQU3_ERYGU|nr:hypothetical protein MIMGU_mgv1a015276mg [Erythranthe guttata]